MRDCTDTCAGCVEFPLEASTATAGRALCAMYGRPQDYNDRACVLFTKANDRAARGKIVKQLHQAQQKGD